MKGKIDIRYKNGEVYLKNLDSLYVYALHIYYDFQGNEGGIDITLPKNWLFKAISNQMVMINMTGEMLETDFVILKYRGSLKIKTAKVVVSDSMGGDLKMQHLGHSSTLFPTDYDYGNIKKETDVIGTVGVETFEMETPIEDFEETKLDRGVIKGGRKSNLKTWVKRFHNINATNYINGSENKFSTKELKRIANIVNKTRRGGY